MRKTVLITMTAALCAVGAVVNAAEENSGWSPVTAWKTPWNWATEHMKWPERHTAAVTPAPARPLAAAPSKDISPLKHPVKYLGAAMSETPIAHGLGYGSKKRAVTENAPATEHDAIALDSPISPPSPQLFISMAEMAERQGNAEQARLHLQKALSMLARQRRGATGRWPLGRSTGSATAGREPLPPGRHVKPTRRRSPQRPRTVSGPARQVGRICSGT